MAALAYIDATGIHIPTYEQVLETLKADYRGIYGQDVYLEPDSQDGQFLAVLALRLHDCHTLAASVYNSFSPSTAQGVGLSRVVKINGLRRGVATYSSVDLHLVGQVGTVIAKGAAKDASGRRWLLPDLVTIPASGEILVTATAEEAGDIRAASGEITAIATPVRGWQSVSNPAAAVPGAPVESDAALRRRQALSTAMPSRTVLHGIVSAVAALDGVTRYKDYENNGLDADANGLPARSIALVVEGGDAQEIASAIARKKAPGVYTHGTTAVQVIDENGEASTIRFFRPTLPAVRAAIVLQALPGYLSTTGEAIRRNVAEHINALRIGESVLLSKLYSAINAAEPVPGRRTFDVYSLRIAADADPLAAANILIPFNAVATCALADVTVEAA